MSSISDDFARQIFFEARNNLSRQGPGSIQSTLRALDSIQSNKNPLNILDIGCGPGTIAIELAKLGHKITAIDLHEPFIKMLSARINEEHMSDRITVLHGDMFHLDRVLNSNLYDVIWCEGAIYVIGFERGLSEWKQFLHKDGYLVCSELTWLTANPPPEVSQFWSQNYPGMRSQQDNFEMIKKCGYELVDSFILAENEWWQEYYGPMEERIHQLKTKYKSDQDAESALEEQQKEIDLYRKYSTSYGYVFYIMKNLSTLNP